MQERINRGRPRQKPPETVAQARIVLTELSPRQKEALDLCIDFARENDQLPPCHLLAKRMNCSSPNAAFLVMTALVRKGVLARNEVSKFRFARIEGLSVFDLAQQGRESAIQAA